RPSGRASRRPSGRDRPREPPHGLGPADRGDLQGPAGRLGSVDHDQRRRSRGRRVHRHRPTRRRDRLSRRAGLVGLTGGHGHPGSVLGVLPGGRGNDFARVLGIPTATADACEVIATGTPRSVDLGSVDGRVFACIASAGFDSDANRIANEAPSWLGGQVYAYGALRALAAWKPATFTIDLDGTERTYRGYSIIAANSSCYGGGMRIAPDARL